MVNWLELIEEKEDQILAEGEKAYKEAINNPHLRYIVEIDENGDVYSWYDVAGGNSFHVSTFEGKSKELFELCFQFLDIEISSDALETKLMIEEGRKVYTINKLYKHSRGFYWKVNRMGYIHIIMPVRMSLNGEINHYEIEDRLLTNDNTLRVTKSYGNYDTILDCIKDIEKDL